MDAHIEQVLKKIIDLDSKASDLEQRRNIELKKIEEGWQQEIKSIEGNLSEANIKSRKIYDDMIKQAGEEVERITEITDKKLEEMEKEYERIKGDVLREVTDKVFAFKGQPK